MSQAPTMSMLDQSKFQFDPSKKPQQKHPSTNLQQNDGMNLEDNLSFVSAITQVNPNPN